MSQTTPSLGVLCVGQIVADVVVRPVDSLPVANRLNVVEDLMLVPGGCACNTACVLAKLGAPTRITGLVGSDALGEAVLGEVATCGVDVSLVRRTSEFGTTAVVVVVASDGGRSFLYRAGTTEQFTGDMVPAGAFGCCGVVHVGGAMKLRNMDLEALLRTARASGCTTTLDTDWDPAEEWLPVIASALPFVDHLITNEEEGERLSGKKGPEAIADALLALGPKNLVVKMGERGSYRACRKGNRRFPAFPVDVVDTTCAGDAFVAGFVYGVASKLPIDDCMVLGNAAGALCATQLSHFGVKSLSGTLDLIRTHRELFPDFGLL